MRDRTAGTVTIGADGTGIVRLAPVRLGASANVTRMIVDTTGSATEPEARVYRNGQLVDGTRTASLDVSEIDAGVLTIHPGENLEARWTGATPGAVARFTVETLRY